MLSLTDKTGYTSVSSQCAGQSIFFLTHLLFVIDAITKALTCLVVNKLRFVYESLTTEIAPGGMNSPSFSEEFLVTANIRTRPTTRVTTSKKPATIDSSGLLEMSLLHIISSLICFKSKLVLGCEN